MDEVVEIIEPAVGIIERPMVLVGCPPRPADSQRLEAHGLPAPLELSGPNAALCQPLRSVNHCALSTTALCQPLRSVNHCALSTTALRQRSAPCTGIQAQSR
jgi:hypothetical protein